MQDVLSRRRFLVSGTTGLSTAWVAANWPAALAAGQHAHHSVQSGVPQQFEFFTPEQATEIDALTSCIIPSDDTPGAREAGAGCGRRAAANLCGQRYHGTAAGGDQADAATVSFTTGDRESWSAGSRDQ